MIRPRGFRHGGVSVDHRIPLRTGHVENAFLPMHAMVVLRESLNATEASPVVSVGQEVREGQLLARAVGKRSANVHSPIPGVVRRIERVRAPGGYDTFAVVVSLEGAFSMLGKKPERYLWKSLNKADIAHIIHDKGIVCVSTGLPLSDILTDRASKPGFVMVVNALEMDPYRRVEETLLSLRPMDVVDGCAIAARVASPGKIIVAVDESVPRESLAAFEAALHTAEPEMTLQFFKRRFPQDMPSQIAAALEVPVAGDLFTIAPATLVALHEAVVSNKPHIEQYVHVGGGAVKNPAILKARIGAPIGDLIEECGGFSGKPEILVIGGPYRGRAAIDLDTPVTRTTRAILALRGDETKTAPERPCVRCGECLTACPEGLDPYTIYKNLKVGRMEIAIATGLQSCTSCGACAYVCRSRIPLVRVFDEARAKEGLS